jgi:hypothetical protein
VSAWFGKDISVVNIIVKKRRRVHFESRVTQMRARLRKDPPQIFWVKERPRLLQDVRMEIRPCPRIPFGGTSIEEFHLRYVTMSRGNSHVVETKAQASRAAQKNVGKNILAL